MKSLFLAVICLFLISCGTNTLEILATGEKVQLFAHPYIVGDTVILFKSGSSDYWEMDVNWTFLNDTMTCTRYDSITYCRFYRQAAVIK